MNEYVLIVDDEEDAREILAIVVSSLQFQVEEAANGKEALVLARKSPPRLVLLDLMMPLMDGFTTLVHLRSDPRTRYVPVIVVTACQSEQVELFRLPGVSQVIQKGSYSIQEMRRLIQNTLSLPTS